MLFAAERGCEGQAARWSELRVAVAVAAPLGWRSESRQPDERRPLMDHSAARSSPTLAHSHTDNSNASHVLACVWTCVRMDGCGLIRGHCRAASESAAAPSPSQLHLSHSASLHNHATGQMTEMKRSMWTNGPRADVSSVPCLRCSQSGHCHCSSSAHSPTASCPQLIP